MGKREKSGRAGNAASESSSATEARPPRAAHDGRLVTTSLRPGPLAPARPAYRSPEPGMVLWWGGRVRPFGASPFLAASQP